MSHTPGPWWVARGNVGGRHPLFVVAQGRDGLLTWSDDDAKLIAAAPDLLAALKLTIEALRAEGRVDLAEERNCGFSTVMDLKMLAESKRASALLSADAAIKKAEGR